MVQIKNSEQLAIMRKAGRITGEAILAARDHIREGVSTRELDTVIRHYIEKCGAKTFVSRIRRLSRQCLHQHQQ